MTVSAGLGAAWPRPQIDASIMVCESSLSNGWFHLLSPISASALAVPTRQGVHLPHDSSWKNFIRLEAAASAESRCDRITTAAEPVKQPLGCSVSKSRGPQPLVAGLAPAAAPPRTGSYD